MRKLAVFVEGYTELQFVDRLFQEIAGKSNVIIEHQKILGGAKAQRQTIIIKAAQQTTQQKYYLLIVDCGSDVQVKTRICEEHASLTNSDFAKIIGIRDVRPTFLRSDIPKLELGLKTRIKTSLIPVEFILCVMEVEAWFLAEVSHFARIDPAITVATIRARLGFDPESGDMSIRTDPREDLDECYKLGGKRYHKPGTATVEALDYGDIYLHVRRKVPYLDRLISSIDQFIS